MSKSPSLRQDSQSPIPNSQPRQQSFAPITQSSFVRNNSNTSSTSTDSSQELFRDDSSQNSSQGSFKSKRPKLNSDNENSTQPTPNQQAHANNVRARGEILTQVLVPETPSSQIASPQASPTLSNKFQIKK